jgi:hypothetical protein
MNESAGGGNVARRDSRAVCSDFLAHISPRQSGDFDSFNAIIVFL